MSGILGAAVACGDGSIAPTVSFRLHGPPPLGRDGRCPATSELTSAQLTADLVRLTYRDAGGGALVRDAVVEFDVPGQIVAVPQQSGRRVDVFAELYRDDGAGPSLVRTGDARDVDLATPGEVRIFVAPRGQFACARESVVQPRAFHAALVLPTGEVLVSGGIVARDDDALLVTHSIERYVDGDFRPVSVPGLLPRAFHSAIALTDDAAGNHRVARVGGVTIAGDPTAVAPLVIGATGQPFRIAVSADAIAAPTEIVTYDVANQSVSAQLLPDALATEPRLAGVTQTAPTAAVIAGGWATADRLTPVITAQTVDRATGGAGDTVGLVTPRCGASVTQVTAAQVAVWGGQLDADALAARSAAGELVPLGGAPVSATISVADPRAFHAAAVAGNGDLIVASGFAVEPGLALAANPRLRSACGLDRSPT